MAQRNDLAEPQANQRIRRPRNAFIFYSNENRRRVSALNPNLDNREISRILGRLWRQLSRDQQYPYWRRAVEERRLHREVYRGYFYSPLTARRRKEELRRERLLRRGIIEENANETVIETKSHIIVTQAEDAPPNRIFRPLFDRFPASPSVQTPTNDSSDFRFMDLLSFLKSKNNIKVDDQLFFRIRTTCSPMESFRNGNQVQNEVMEVMTGSDGALTNTSSSGPSNQVIDTRSQGSAQIVEGFFRRN